MKRRNIIKMSIASMLLACAVYACTSVPLTGRKRVDLVNDDVILASSFQSYKEFMDKAPRSTNTAQTRRVTTIGTRIAKATEEYLKAIGLESEAKKFAWEFNLVSSKQVNAFCMPGGKIVVFEGLLPLAANDDELATVMSHEVAHAVAKHANERMSQQVLQQYGGNLLGIALGKQSIIVRQIAGSIYGLGSQMLVMLPYSRTHEYEADRIGLYLMAMAGYKPESAISFWQKMSSKKGNAQEEGSDMWSTHPADSKRIKAIRDELPRVQTFMTGKPSKKLPQPLLVQQLNKNRQVPIKTKY